MRLIILSLFMLAAPALAADWPEHRGNAARTGCIDAKPGPKSAKVRWVYTSPESFVAPPVTDGQRLFVSTLGAQNVSFLYALPLDSQGTPKPLWRTAGPPAIYLRNPVVCPLAILGNMMVFGDGMHQIDGGFLHALAPDTARMYWQYPVPGTLVHLEGSPALADGRAYACAGAAGIICVDTRKITLEGNEVEIDQVPQILEAKWKVLEEQYKKDMAKDPDFAIKPSRDQLPKPSPRRLWQAGNEKWHVDAAPTLVGDKLLVASAYLDVERVGKRALISLDARTGKEQWATDLQVNPWGGASVINGTIVIGCASIRFDPKEVPGKGQVVALDLETGALKWKKDLPGGVVSSIALTEDLAVVTAADGKVRALALKDGAEKWTHTSKSAYFASPAVAGGVAYVADIRGSIAALNLADGNVLWTLDLNKAPISADGFVYGSPIVHDGRLYVATCSLNAAVGSTKNVLVCIGE